MAGDLSRLSLPTARFRLNYRGVGELLRSPGIEAAVLLVAEAIKTEAEATAPVGTPPDDRSPGRYKRSFRVIGQRTRKRGGRRFVAYVRNIAHYSAHVEYGADGGRGGAHHTLGRAALAGARSVLQ